MVSGCRMPNNARMALGHVLRVQACAQYDLPRSQGGEQCWPHQTPSAFCCMARAGKRHVLMLRVVLNTKQKRD